MLDVDTFHRSLFQSHACWLWFQLISDFLLLSGVFVTAVLFQLTNIHMNVATMSIHHTDKISEFDSTVLA